VTVGAFESPFEDAQDAPRIGVGMLGYAFMGKAHSAAYRTLPHLLQPPPVIPSLVSIAGRDRAAVAAAAKRYGFRMSTTDWRTLVEDPEVSVLDNGAPNSVHAEPTIAAAEAGKHVICEKPLGRTADEAFEMWRRVAAAGVVHMTAFNYRFVPAVRLAREIVASGQLGEVVHFRGSYLQDWGQGAGSSWRFIAAEAGSGSLGDLGAHLIDLARYLVGDIESVFAALQTIDRSHEVDDGFQALIEFSDGARGTIEASRFALGHKNALCWEINGTLGSLIFNLERLNELAWSSGDSGFRVISVTDPGHPFMHQWWPPGHTIGWEHTFVHELHHFLTAVATDGSIGPHGATFEDGYRAAEICEAIIRSAMSGRCEEVAYRTLGT